MWRRVIDVGGSFVLLVVCSPLLLITALAVWMNDRGPILFRQTRAGLNGRSFEVLKFRSMRVNNRSVDTSYEVGQKDPLVTTIGGWLRRSKVDELPQLINVIRGDMSWIGPRPTLLSQVEHYTDFQRRRLEILPGMTGWAQVNGGAEISWSDRIILEVWYVEHRSLGLDLRIVWRTLGVLMYGHHANYISINQARDWASRQPGAAELGITAASASATQPTAFSSSAAALTNSVRADRVGTP